MVNSIWGQRLSDTYLLECLDNSIKYKTTELINKKAMLYHVRIMNATRSTLKRGDIMLNIIIENYEREIMFLRDDIEFLNKQIDLIRGRLEDESA